MRTDRDGSHGELAAIGVERASGDVTTTKPERLVKSAERVRDLGEVFTPAPTVQAMLNLLPEVVWDVHPSATFLEPACGDGNFLVAILERKLASIAAALDAGTLPAGDTREAARYHALEALSSVYAVDISVDNIVGGTPGHEIGARERLLTQLTGWYVSRIGGRLTERSPFVAVANWVLERNVLIGDMLAVDTADPSGSDGDLPLVEFEWVPTSMTVTVSTTTMRTVLAAKSAMTSGALPLFAANEPATVWSGKALRLHKAPVAAPEPKVLDLRHAERVG